MGFLDFIKKQFIDIIQWTEDGDDVLAWRFPMRDLEIQQGAQLTVRETQAALFVDQGKPADLFGPGQHTIKTQNLPLLTDLRQLGQAVRVAVQERRLLLLDAAAAEPEVGHRRTRSRSATASSARCACAPSASTASASRRRASSTRRSRARRDTYIDRRSRGAAAQLGGGACSTDHFAESNVPFLDMAANQVELGAAVARQAAPDLRRARSRARGLPDPERLAARGAAEAARRAHRHGRRRRHGPLHAVPDRAVDSDRGRRTRAARRAPASASARASRWARRWCRR